MKVYIDLNIFDRLEKLDRLDPPEKVLYQCLFDLLANKQVIAAYSNAHSNDLFRGFQKNPTYIDGHLHNIQKFTYNLCVCQYWGEKMRLGIIEIFLIFLKKRKKSGNMNQPLMKHCLRIFF